MALLSLMQEFYGGQIYVAHVEHGIRRGSSIIDQEFVTKYCEELGIPFYLKKGEVLEKMEKGESVEMAARRIRYDFLEEVRTLTGAEWIATGHTQDDQVETILLNLIRGTGIRGLSGIREIRGHIVRPILTYTREELRTYLEQKGIPWREDETNEDIIYTRNKIRHMLLPSIKTTLKVNIDQRLLGLSKEAFIESGTTTKKSEALLKWVQVTSLGAMVAWNTVILRSLSANVIHKLIRHQGHLLNLKTLTRSRTEELSFLMLNKNRWRFQWEDDVEICGDRAFHGWLRREDLYPFQDMTVVPKHESKIHVEWGRWEVECETMPSCKVYSRGDYCATLPWDGRSPLVIKSLKNALKERFSVGNMRNLPWWNETQWPFFILDKKSNYWTPRQYTGYYEALKYAIIIRVKRRR